MIKKILLICCCGLLFCLTGFAQSPTVTGRVVSALDKQPMAGVTVSVKGTSNGAMTNVNGAFSLNVPAGKTTLTVSFIGYVSKSVEVTGGQSNIEIALTEDVQQLNDVVVVGYSSKKQNELTSAVTVVSANK